uniref:Calcium-activated potassium channel subunit beta n=1 Tax=Canis lupus dingo TaxID=286419 RepID=A0A8C0JTH1_CANLU
MFIWTSGRTSSSYRHDEKRNIYQKIRDHDLLDKRKTVTALKAGEDRAILLGLAMMVCSIMMYFLLGITLLRSYMQSVWTEESQCTLLNATITDTFNCSFSCGPDCWKLSQYPCLQVHVNLTSSGERRVFIFKFSHSYILPFSAFKPSAQPLVNITTGAA